MTTSARRMRRSVLVLAVALGLVAPAGQGAHEGDSFIAALDASTGRELWRQARPEPTTWATPLVVPVGDRIHVIANGQQQVRGYDLETGEVLWHGPGLTFNSIPSPVHVNGVAYLTSGFQGNVLLAVDLSRARGDIEKSGALL